MFNIQECIFSYFEVGGFGGGGGGGVGHKHTIIRIHVGIFFLAYICAAHFSASHYNPHQAPV